MVINNNFSAIVTNKYFAPPRQMVKHTTLFEGICWLLAIVAIAVVLKHTRPKDHRYTPPTSADSPAGSPTNSPTSSTADSPAEDLPGLAGRDDPYQDADIAAFTGDSVCLAMVAHDETAVELARELPYYLMYVNKAIICDAGAHHSSTAAINTMMQVIPNGLPPIHTHECHGNDGYQHRVNLRSMAFGAGCAFIITTTTDDGSFYLLFLYMGTGYVRVRVQTRAAGVPLCQVPHEGQRHHEPPPLGIAGWPCVPGGGRLDTRRQDGSAIWICGDGLHNREGGGVEAGGTGSCHLQCGR